MSKPDDLYESIGNIWGGNTIFFYDREQAINQLNKESFSPTSEQPPEYLKQTLDKKWESMDYSWFQLHKHLSPNEKKKDPS